jgi:hypothetical protein
VSLKPYYTSTDIIEDVKRTISVPLNQNTFSEDDILKMTNKELFLTQVPSILQYHDEYLVYTEDVDLIFAKNKYPIPSRAIGMKLRDVFFKDNNGNVYEMSKISPDDKSYFQRFAGAKNSPFHFYLEGNNVVITPVTEGMGLGKLQFVYYMRPNSLVTNDRAAICTAFLKQVTVDNSTLVSGDTLQINDLLITTGTDFTIGATSQASAVNLSAFINTSEDYTATVSGSIVTVRYELLSTTFTSNSLGMVVQTSQVIEFDQVPSNITNSSLVDFLQTTAGHVLYDHDVKLGKNAVSLNTITFNSGVIPADFVVGDYICTAHECIIPQIPDDLHPLLIERTCARILESMGDTEGLKNVNTKISELEARQATIIDNRVEGAPSKILNRHSLLRYGKSRGIRGRL